MRLSAVSALTAVTPATAASAIPIAVDVSRIFFIPVPPDLTHRFTRLPTSTKMPDAHLYDYIDLLRQPTADPYRRAAYFDSHAPAFSQGSMLDPALSCGCRAHSLGG